MGGPGDRVQLPIFAADKPVDWVRPRAVMAQVREAGDVPVVDEAVHHPSIDVANADVSQRVHYGVDDCLGCAHGGRLTDTLGSDRMMWRRRDRAIGLPVWCLHGGEQNRSRGPLTVDGS